MKHRKRKRNKLAWKDWRAEVRWSLGMMGWPQNEVKDQELRWYYRLGVDPTTSVMEITS